MTERSFNHVDTFVHVLLCDCWRQQSIVYASSHDFSQFFTHFTTVLLLDWSYKVQNAQKNDDKRVKCSELSSSSRCVTK